jgi:hypothetical protein
MREFELLGTGEDKPNPLLLERLKACAAVIDALGYKARHWDRQRLQAVHTLGDAHRVEFYELRGRAPSGCRGTNHPAGPLSPLIECVHRYGSRSWNANPE